ncbi:MAG TPA: creatininase family protein [Candidatus Dormibacteraeota bacterium]|nr:creatininase family protein [Candidatus Dormibacteraeota bacterium]
MELFIERLTWTDVEAALGRGMRRAIICAASTEQHGPHLPEATDALLGEAYAQGLARRLGDALVAPIVRPACSEHHMAFPGSLTISDRLLMDLLDAYLASLRRHGFERFVVMSSHGGNFPVLAEWERTRSPQNSVVLTDFHVFEAGFEAIRRFGRTDTAGPHAEVLETSMMLHLHPVLVHMERAVSGFTGESTLEDVLNRGMRSITPNGILGDPVGSTAEMGAVVLDAIVDRLYELVQRHAA